MNKLLLYVVTIIVAVSGIALYSCSSGGGGGGLNTTSLPKPTATLIPDSPAVIHNTTSIVITFSTSMEYTSLLLGGTLAAESNGGRWSTGTSINDTLTISPATAWSSGSHTLTIYATDIADTAIDTLNLSYIVDSTLPVASISPPNGSTIATTTSIIVLYSKTMDPASLSASGTLWGEGDGGSWSDNNSSDDTLTVAPATAWSTGGHTLDISVNEYDPPNSNITLNLSYTVSSGQDGDGDGSPSELDCDDADASVYPGAAELCNGVDDDCDPGTADGSGESWLGDACDGADSDLCQEGTYSCMAGNQSCSDSSSDNLEVCNGLDDDCDGTVDNGCDCIDGNTQSCYTGDPATNGVGLCSSGIQTCSAGIWGACIGEVTPTTELCDGADNDCDGAVDDGNPGGGASCDTGQEGVCAAGTEICSGGTIICEQNVSPSAELCNGLDDDCNAATADGSDEATLGDACDGPDSDLCQEGIYDACSGGVLSCTDNTSSTLDVCDGADNDCDASSADGSEDPALGDACDGPDSDLCQEGIYDACSGGALSCTDSSSDSIESCNGIDDDCDGSVDEGGAVLCDDGYACTTDSCASGVCVNTANDTYCDDTLYCTGDETCNPSSPSADGAGCVSGTAVDCSGLDDECNAGVCDEGGDICTKNPLPAGTSCAGGTGSCDGTGVCVIP